MTVPRQDNYDDCGLFAMVYMYFICWHYMHGTERATVYPSSYGVGFDFYFEARTVGDWRRRIALDIMEDSLARCLLSDYGWA